jgi:hypothetical protein
MENPSNLKRKTILVLASRYTNGVIPNQSPPHSLVDADLRFSINDVD